MGAKIWGIFMTLKVDKIKKAEEIMDKLLPEDETLTYRYSYGGTTNAYKSTAGNTWVLTASGYSGIPVYTTYS